jgi:hypothetical protein
MIRAIGVTAFIAFAAAVVASPVAQADAQDDQFMQLISAQGIPGDPAALVSVARDYCVTPSGGLGTVALSGRMAAQGLSMQQMMQVFGNAEKVYCPDR